MAKNDPAQNGPPIDDAPPPDRHPDDAPIPKAVETYSPANVTRAEPSGGALVLAARAEAEIKARTWVAIERPRQFFEVRRRLLEACARPRFAETAIYTVPRGGKDVQGLTIRFAEECARHYGNLDIGSIVITDDDDFRTFECYVVDLETNVPWRRSVPVPKTVERKSVQKGDEVLRSRTNSKGQMLYIVRATDEQTFTLQNAMISKTLRTLILNQIPSDLREEAQETIEGVLSGEIKKDPTAFRKKLVDAFGTTSVSVGEIEEYLGKALVDASEAELRQLNKLGVAIAAKEADWKEIMRDVRESRRLEAAESAKVETGKSAGAAAQLAAKLGGKGEVSR